MLVSIKPHSSISKYFNGTELQVDLSCYADVLDYIRSMHPAFTKYIHTQANNGLQETFTLLDKNLHELSSDEMVMRKPHKGDVIHIVPSIVGGGGKRGGIMLLAAAALIFFAPAMLAAAGVAGTATATAALGTAGAVANIGVLGTTLGAITSTLGLNLALMGISMLLTPKTPTAETSRDNGAFGSLTNTTSSGTPVALHYGLVRVAGQLISGYTQTINTSNGDEVTVSQVLNK